MYFKLSIFIFLLPSVFCQNCILPYKNFPTKEPVFLKPDLNLIEPDISAIELFPNEEINLSCPGSRNFLLITSNSLEKASCVQYTTLKIGTQNYNLTSLNCSKSVTGDILVTSEVCGNGRGVIKIIGHNITSDTFDNLIRICYDDLKGEAIYSEHTLYGSAIDYAKKESSRPSFKSAGLGPGVTADESYKQAAEKVTITNTLQSESLGNYYINTSSYFARGHLSPDADFVYVSSQFATYFYINTMPQWQAINNGNWKSVETAVRNTASNYGTPFRIWTGGYDILSLNDVNGVPQNIHLVASSKLPVPRFTWKIAQNLDSMDAIAFVTLNNPFVGDTKDTDKLCQDICSPYGWNNVAYSNSSKGFTYCCDVNSLRSAIPTIPFVNYANILSTNK